MLDYSTVITVIAQAQGSSPLGLRTIAIPKKSDYLHKKPLPNSSLSS